MKVLRKYGSVLVLAACIAAALVFRRFTFVAWYPVLMSVSAACGFALSLLGREPLCLTLARKVPPHILPEGAEDYCRKYTVFWACWLAVNGLIAVGTIYAPGPVWRLEKAGLDVPCVWVAWNCCLSYCATALIVLAEFRIRRRRFAAVFHTSGSTARPKRIVKSFDTLAKEVAYHLAQLRREGVLPRRADGTGPLFLCTIEPQHMYGRLWRVLLPKAAGCAVDPEVILTPETLLAKMRSAEKVFLVTTPSFLDRFCAYADQYDVPRNCVEITTSGALLTAATSAAAKRVFGVAPREIFGSTETGGVAWRRQDEPDCAWRVFDLVKVRANAEGRLVVDSPFSFERGFVMGDGVELEADGRGFRLLGRMDRLVKIAEQRVSLPEMETRMQELPEVKEAALATLAGRHGDTLGAVVVLDPSVDVSVGKKALALALRRKLLPVFPRGAAPKRYRFVMELPRNAQGKVQTAKLREILETNLVEPFVSNVAQDAETWSADLVFDAGAPYFGGHFDGFPVLPGVVQLGMATHFAGLFLRRELTLDAVKKMKFTNVVTPGMRVRLTLARTSDHEMSCEYRRGETTCSSGILCF